MVDFWCDSNRSSLQLKCNNTQKCQGFFHNTQKCQGFFQLFAQAGGGGKIRLYGLMGEGGASMHPCAKHVGN